MGDDTWGQNNSKMIINTHYKLPGVAHPLIKNVYTHIYYLNLIFLVIMWNWILKGLGERQGKTKQIRICLQTSYPEKQEGNQTLKITRLRERKDLD